MALREYRTAGLRLMNRLYLRLLSQNVPTERGRLLLCVLPTRCRYATWTHRKRGERRQGIKMTTGQELFKN